MRCEWCESLLLLLCERSECPGVRRVCEREHERERLRVSRESMSTKARAWERLRDLSVSVCLGVSVSVRA